MELGGWEMKPDPSRDWDGGEGTSVELKRAPSQHCLCGVLQRRWVSWRPQGVPSAGALLTHEL